jgi:pyrimidine-specific ribonucleoside hydrolase
VTQRYSMVAAFLLALALLASCGPAADPPQLRAQPLPLVVDTDMGADDVLALLYLLQRPDIELRAVTVSGTGIAHCDSGVGLARALLAELGREQVQVACGRTTPLQGDHTLPPLWREAPRRAFGLPLELDLAAAAPDATEALRAATAAGPITILALGPLTNLGAALQADAALAAQVERLVVMGGALDVPGNLGAAAADNITAEWNMYVDPVAADIAFRSGVRVDLVSLDSTNTLPVTQAFARRLAREGATPAAELAARLLEGQHSS